MGAERQQALSNKLLLYYELERAVAATERPNSPVIPAVAIIQEAARHTARHEKRGSDLMLDCASVRLAVNANHLGRAVSELVENALRFSAPGQPVVVAGQARDDWYWLEVLDQGPGMTADECAHVGPFHQFRREKREQQGLGLGLAIVRSVATIAGGRLQLIPRTDRSGLRAILSLPIPPNP